MLTSSSYTDYCILAMSSTRFESKGEIASLF
jgi:hypothetical protein